MLLTIVAAIMLTLIASAYAANLPDPIPTTQTFPFSSTLQGPDLFYAYWSYTNQDITMELHVKMSTGGWLLFGIQGPQTYSDVVVYSMYADGTGHYSERTLFTSNKTAIINPNLSWMLQDAFINQAYVVLKFARNIKLQCNQFTPNYGVDINTGNMNLVFSTGSSFDPTVNSLTVSTINTTQVNLLQNSPPGAVYNCVSPTPVPTFTSVPTSYYANNYDLIPGNYRFYWNFTDTNLIGEIHCKTNGWVGFGFSPNGAMSGSNVVVGWINATSGKVYFTDRYIDNNRNVLMTTNQLVTLLASGQINGYTYFKFQRNITICDSQHLSIDKGAPHTIFAWGDSIPSAGSDISYHGATNRGTHVLNILNVAPIIPDNVPNTQTLDITISNVVLPKLDTYYYCKLFQVPINLSPKRHIYKYEIIMPKINVNNMHHLVGYECLSTYNGSPSPSTHDCFTDPVKTQLCNTASFVWAVGGNLVTIFPSNTGYPIGQDSGYSYIMVELHYNNPVVPSPIGYIDQITLRFYMTQTLRPNELGVLTVGTGTSPMAISIPPGISNFPLMTYCTNACMNANLLNQNLTIISAMPHTHLTGTAVYTKLIRNGKDIGYVFNEPNYDFNYQQTFTLTPYVTLTKNDALITRCVYDTSAKTAFTFGGFSSQKEMCFDFLMYYPRSSFRFCASVPYLVDYIDFLNKNISALDPNFGHLDYDYNQLEDSLYNISSLTPNMTQSNKTKLINSFLSFFNSSKIVSICENFDSSVTQQIVPKNIYIEPNGCNVVVVPSPPKTIGQIILSIINSIFGWLFTSSSKN